MKVQVLICFTQFLVINSITVPPVWPKQNDKFSFHHPAQIERTTPIPITHENFQFPSFFPDDSISKSSEKILQYQSPIKQNVHIYHPQTNTNSRLDNHSPQSFQIVHFEPQTPNIQIHPKNVPIKQKNNNRKASRNTKKKLPIIHQHLTEVTANTQNHPKHVPTATHIKERIAQPASSNENSQEAYNEDEPISEHEQPRDVPTRPIYPGEGQWAKYGIKHKPYINQEPKKVHETAESIEDERPEGYETFERGEEKFQIAQNKFKHNLELFPQKHQLPQSQIDDSDAESKPLYKQPEIGFVPQKLYTQVRRTENEQHLPRSAIDPEQEENADRLREVVKDSIIHTVYTEEGYEDSAYDHAGHEKNAEENEGHAERASNLASAAGKGHGKGRSRYSDEGGRRYGKDIVSRRLKNNQKSKIDNFNDAESYEKVKKQIEHDAEEASSNHESTKIDPNKTQVKEIKKVTLKNMDEEEINMEIHTEVKYTPQLKKHKYIKIIPSAKKSDTTTQKPHIRVKRYDKEKLSKRYVRKRPTYYWKKNRTTTERLPIANRQKFENAFKTNTKKKQTTENIEEEDFKITTNKPVITKITTTKSANSLETSSSTLAPISSTTATITTPYSITLPAVTKSGITTTTTLHSTSSSGISPPRIVEELHPDLMNPELTTKAAKPSAPKVLPVKIRKFIKKRVKRYAVDYPNIKVDLKEFTDVDKLPNPIKKADLTYIKYPYYNLPITDNLNENSPLRYAEDMKNIPVKIENEMSFYKSRNHIICPEVDSDVNPIPDSVKNQKEGEETDKMAETPDLPRLKGLGDRIDCFKEKYFGENPLDSPFFQEEIIDSPIPHFLIKKTNPIHQNFDDKAASASNTMYYKMRKSKNKNENEKVKIYNYRNEEETTDGYPKKRDLKIKILEPIVVLDDDLFESATMNPIHKTTEAVLKPPYTIEEMMSMQKEKFVPFNPKNDYHQISLLEQNEPKKVTTENNSESPNKEKFLIIYENQDYVSVGRDDFKKLPKKKEKKLIKSGNNEYDNSRFSGIISDLTSLSFRENENKYSTSTETNQPEIHTRKPYSKRPTTKKPTITKLSAKAIKKPQPRIRSTTTEPPLTTTTTTTTEKYVLSTYKAPVIQQYLPQTARIVQTTEEPVSSSSQSPETESHISLLPETQTNNPKLPENWGTLNRRLSALYNIFDITQYFSRPVNHRDIASEVQYKDEIKPSEQMKVYTDVLKTINEAKDDSQSNLNENNSKVVNQQVTSSTNTPIKNEDAIAEMPIQDVPKLTRETLPVRNQPEQIQDASRKIIGLVPPPNSLPYQQVYQYYNEYILNPPPSEEQIAEASNNLNYFYIFGLKPPKQENKIKLHRIAKRNISLKPSKTYNQGNDDLLTEKSKINNFIAIKTRNKRNVYNFSDDDLMMAESENRPVYSATPQRKPKVYTEIVRNRPTRPKVEEIEEEEEEDLNPRKRLYVLQSMRPTTTQLYPEFEEIVEEEIPEQTEPPTTRKPVIYPVEAHKGIPSIPEYIFFIDKLKDKWAKEDATSTTTSTTPQPTTKTVMTQFVAETVNERRGEPAFLQIINQLHQIRKEEEEEEVKTTSIPTESSVEITSANVQAIPVRNRNPYVPETGIPDSFMSELKSMQIKLDHDNTAEGSSNPEIARTRNYSNRFKTTIDTSKYKTIERSPVNLRHNFSSRYNADDGILPLTKVQTTQTPMIIAIITKPDSNISTTESTEETDIIAKVITDTLLENSPTTSTSTSTSTTTTTTTTTTTVEPETKSTTTFRSRQRGRGRPRPTITTTSTLRPQTVATSNPLFRRRRPTRTTTTTTTQPPSSLTNFSRRRNRLKASETKGLLSEVPTNHKESYIPVTEESTETVVVVTPVPVTNNKDEPKKQRRFQKVQERRVTSEVTLTRFFEPVSGEVDESEELEESKKHQYEVIGPLTHTEKGHGGNYRHEHEPTESYEDESTTINEGYSEDQESPESFFSDPNLAENVNLLKDTDEETSTTKSQASNNLFTNEEIAEKVSQKPLHSKVNLYPNMARMVNRLAESKPQEVTVTHQTNDETKNKPTFIKDPSRRMYFYAKL